jgi:hypothetical protein
MDVRRCDGSYGAHDLGTAWYTVISPDRTLRRFCDGDCLRQALAAEQAAFEAGLRAEMRALSEAEHGCPGCLVPPPGYCSYGGCQRGLTPRGASGGGP